MWKVCLFYSENIKQDFMILKRGGRICLRNSWGVQGIWAFFFIDCTFRVPTDWADKLWSYGVHCQSSNQGVNWVK